MRAAQQLHDNVQSECSSSIGFWGRIEATVSCPLTDVCSRAANQVVNCMTSGDCGNTDGDWRGVVADPNNGAYSISPDCVGGWNACPRFPIRARASGATTTIISCSGTPTGTSTGAGTEALLALGSGRGGTPGCDRPLADASPQRPSRRSRGASATALAHGGCAACRRELARARCGSRTGDERTGHRPDRGRKTRAVRR